MKKKLNKLAAVVLAMSASPAEAGTVPQSLDVLSEKISVCAQVRPDVFQNPPLPTEVKEVLQQGLDRGGVYPQDAAGLLQLVQLVMGTDNQTEQHSVMGEFFESCFPSVVDFSQDPGKFIFKLSGCMAEQAAAGNEDLNNILNGCYFQVHSGFINLPAQEEVAGFVGECLQQNHLDFPPSKEALSQAILGCASGGGDHHEEQPYPEQSPSPAPAPSEVPQPSLCQSNPNPVFSSPFTDYAQIAAITPLGVVANGGETKARHQVQIGEYKEVPVYAPADAKITMVRYQSPGAGNEYWGAVLQVSCEVSVHFDHITRMGAKLAAATPQGMAMGSPFVEPLYSVNVQAGELLGFTTGTVLGGAYSFDATVYNDGHENQFANQDRYLNPMLRSYLTADCLANYYSGDLKSQFMARLGFEQPVPGATCRSASRDVAGTLAGMWWLEGPATDLYGPQFAIATELNQTVRADFATGSAIVLGYYNGAPGNYLDPALVTTGQQYCYEMDPGMGGGYLYFHLVTDQEVRVAIRKPANLQQGEAPNLCPLEFPQNYVVYRR